MAWTQSDLDTLKAAYALGARKVRYADGREVEYRSLADMKAIMDDIAAELGAPKGPNRVVGGYNPGLMS